MIRILSLAIFLSLFIQFNNSEADVLIRQKSNRYQATELCRTGFNRNDVNEKTSDPNRFRPYKQYTSATGQIYKIGTTANGELEAVRGSGDTCYLMNYKDSFPQGQDLEITTSYDSALNGLSVKICLTYNGGTIGGYSCEMYQFDLSDCSYKGKIDGSSEGNTKTNSTNIKKDNVSSTNAWYNSARNALILKQGESCTGDMKIRVLSSDGKIIMEGFAGKLSDHSIQLPKLKNGVYLFILYGNQGYKTGSFVVKQ